jgi:hypothetical protein
MTSRLWASAALLPLLSACQNGPTPGEQSASNQPEIGITREVQAYYEKYRQEHLPLAFVVSQDGQWATYRYCEAMRCVGGGHPTGAQINQTIADCNEKAALHGPCTVFAIGVEAPRKYHLID